MLVSLRALCIVQGCLNLRTGGQLCRPHDIYTAALARQRGPVMEQERRDTLASRLLLLSVLQGKVREAIDAARKEMGQLILPGTMLRPTLDDGTPVGSVSLPLGGTKASVNDPDALARWVGKHYPTEVQLKTVVAEAFQAKVLAMSEAAGQPCGPGGEIAPNAPAGVTVVQTRNGALRVTPNKDRAAELWTAARTQAMELTNHDQ